MIHDLLPIFAKGITLGFSAGIAPGPLTFLVITQTLRFGLFEGFKVALAPLITDIPILLICVLIMTRIEHVPLALALISLLGSYFLAKMAVDNWMASPLSSFPTQEKPASLVRGVIANLLNPHPYLFWLTIGTPIILQSPAHPFASGAVFMFGMFLLMIGTKIAIAAIARGFRPWLSGSGYRWVLRGSAILLSLFALMFFREALRHLRLSI